MPARRLLAVARGGGGFSAPALAVSGPYGQDVDHAETILTQLHCHTTGSDGTQSPATIVGYYLSRGYRALAITDHNVVTSQPAGVENPIPGNEINSGASPHVIGLNPGAAVAPSSSAQAMIDAIRTAGGEAHVAHPNWGTSALSAGSIASLTDFYGIEIHNGVVMYGAGQNPVTNPGFAVAKWDAVLATKRDTWGIAVDDYHDITDFEIYDAGRVQVFAANNTMADVIAALVDGQFVADVGNYGVTPGYPIRGTAAIRLECGGATSVEAWGSSGLLASESGEVIVYPYTGSEDYVRLVAVGDYNETFSAARPHYWLDYSGSWTVTGGVLRFAAPDSNAYMTFIRRHREGDFQASIKVTLGHASAAFLLLFNVLTEDTYYGIRIGPSAIPAEDDQLAIRRTQAGVLTNPATTPYVADPAAQQLVEIDYTAATGRIRAKVREVGDPDPGWMIDQTSTTWTWGGYGLRAASVVGQVVDFDDLYVNGFRTYYQPVRIDP